MSASWRMIMVDLPLSVSNLVYVSDAEPGIRRERRGKGFCFRLPCGSLVKDAGRWPAFASSAFLPPIATLWICLSDQGHLQATGFDARGRKQYRYHLEWQSQRSGHKFDQLAAFGASLPRLRRRIARDLAAGAENETGVLAAIAMLLDLAHIRVGNLAYARGKQHLWRHHAPQAACAHPGRPHRAEIPRERRQNACSARLNIPGCKKALRPLRISGRRLFAWRDAEGSDHAIVSGKLNAYLCDAAGMSVSAKTFRTWGGSVAAFDAAMAAIGKARRGVKTRVRRGRRGTAQHAGDQPQELHPPKVLDLALPDGEADVKDWRRFLPIRPIRRVASLARKHC